MEKRIISPSHMTSHVESKGKVKGVKRLNRRAIIITAVAVTSIGLIIINVLAEQQENNPVLAKRTLAPKLEPSSTEGVIPKNILLPASAAIAPVIGEKKPAAEEEATKKLQSQLMEENLKARTSPIAANGFMQPEKQAQPKTPVTTPPAAAAKDANYLQAERIAAISPYEVKAGSQIPAVMISGINSDLPGMITAQVRENIYDTRTGNYLLIPQGAKLVGRYDSQIAYGQSRVLVVWERLIFPDTSSINLLNMPGSDTGGYAGFGDKVNNHYARIFGSAILLSMIETGARASQPDTGGTPTTNLGIGQIAGASLGTQMGQTAGSLMQKNLNTQPTIEIRPGYLFNVMVSKDMVLPGVYTAMQPTNE